jgi:hypothetical protein
LGRDYASTLGKRESPPVGIPAGESEFPGPIGFGKPDERAVCDQQSFLDKWKGRIPSDLAIVYIGLIGRSEPFKHLANEWASEATGDVDIR